MSGWGFPLSQDAAARSQGESQARYFGPGGLRTGLRRRTYRAANIRLCPYFPNQECSRALTAMVYAGRCVGGWFVPMRSSEAVRGVSSRFVTLILEPEDIDAAALA
jgi:hypothetical protein